MDLILNNLGVIIIVISLIGMSTNNRNLILSLLTLELFLLGLNLLLIESSLKLDNLEGILLSIIILVIGAAELSIALTILVGYYRIKGSVSLSYLNIIKG